METIGKHSSTTIMKNSRSAPNNTRGFEKNKTVVIHTAMYFVGVLFIIA